jgi:hypothetical protein
LGGCAEQLITEHLAGHKQLADAKQHAVDHHNITIKHAVHEPQQLRLTVNQPEQQLSEQFRFKHQPELNQPEQH